jgi:hypothetical protein
MTWHSFHGALAAWAQQQGYAVFPHEAELMQQWLDAHYARSPSGQPAWGGLALQGQERVGDEETPATEPEEPAAAPQPEQPSLFVA